MALGHRCDVGHDSAEGDVWAPDYCLALNLCTNLHVCMGFMSPDRCSCEHVAEICCLIYLYPEVWLALSAGTISL